MQLDGTVSEFVNMLKSMVGTPIAKQDTQSVIDGRQDSVEIKEGFETMGLIKENSKYNQTVEGIKTHIDAHLMEVIEYVKILEPHKSICLENAESSMDEFAEASLEEWKALLDKSQAQAAMFKAIPLTASVGGIFVATNARSKELLMPSPKPMLSETHRTLHG